MRSLRNINSFALVRGTESLVVGDRLGNIALLDSRDFSLLDFARVASGTIQVIAAAAACNRFALLCKDHTFAILTVENGRVVILTQVNTFADMKEDGKGVIFSSSQAISLSAVGDRVVVLSPNCQALVYDIDDVGRATFVKGITFSNRTVAVTFKWIDRERFLIGFTDGCIGRCHVPTGMVNLVKLPDISESVHWFEQETQNSFLVACDARCLIRFNCDDLQTQVGGKFAKDDFEHVIYDREARRVFATSFDRNVYEIDPDSLECTGVAFRGPFKMRWGETRHEEGRLFLYVLVRNGTLLKVDLASGNAVLSLETSSPALWTAIRGTELPYLFGGEGGLFLLKSNKITRWSINAEADRILQDTYVKRLVGDPDTSYAVATTSGKLIAVLGGKTTILEMGSAIRDIEFCGERSLVACLESGDLVSVDLQSPASTRTMFSSQGEPFWSLAVNSERGVVAVGERVGSLYLLSISHKDGDKPIASSDTKLPKRMKWVDSETLLVTRSDSVDRIQTRDGMWHHDQSFYLGQLNTVEDFVVLGQRRWLVGVTYAKNIVIWDYVSGERLSASYWNYDYAKGLIRTGADDEVLVFGRQKTIKRYVLHDCHVVCNQVIADGY